MIKEIGKYNVAFMDLSYDGMVPYEMVIIEEFNGDEPVRGKRKTLYFRQNMGTERKYIMPEFKNEESVEVWLQYPNNSKIQIYQKTVVEKVK